MGKRFLGDQKNSTYVLERFQLPIVDALVRNCPRSINSIHMTLLSLPISLLLILAGYLSSKNMYWLFASSVLIISSWLADSCDGALGKSRKEGLRRWGFFMDHMLDYFFLIAVSVSYGFIFEGIAKTCVYLFIPLMGAYMMNSFLAYGASGRFRVTYYNLGPTEIKIGLSLLNIYVIFYGTGYVGAGLPYVLAFLSLVLTLIIYQTQKEIIGMDRGST